VSEAPTTPLRLEATEVSKTFGRYRALDRVTIEVVPGELHGLVGQNGSGKSTFAKILTGIYPPDRGGRIEVDGEEMHLPVRPLEMRRHGLAVVHQTLGLLDDFTVLENLRLGRYGRRRLSRRIDWSAERAAVTGVMERLELDIDLNARVADLSAEAKAGVAIARALQDHAEGRGLIVFDESTRALSRDVLDRFYRLVRGVLADGAAALLICHRLEEVIEQTDRVTVLRDGRVAAGGLETASLTEAELARTMLGYTLTRHVSSRQSRAQAGDEWAPAVALGVAGGGVENLDVTVAPGEIVGLTGLIGSGYEDVPYLLAGARPATAGSLSLGERAIELVGGEGVGEKLIDAGVFLVPGQRDVLGLMMDQSIRDNITLPRVQSKGGRLFIGRRWQQEEVDTMIERLGITPAAPNMLVSALSGGNQQKVLLAKWLAGRPRFLLLDEPTQAVDVGARQDLLANVERVAEQGCPVLLASADAEELSALCDRIIVFREGSILAELSAGLSPDAIIEATFSRPEAPQPI
jgi:ribose transport system ATP-binding protein